MNFFIIKVLALCTLSTVAAVLWTPMLTHYLYKYKCWKKKSGKLALDGTEAAVFNSLHKNKEVNTPRMGGLLIVITVIIVWLIFVIGGEFWPGSLIAKLNFASKSQTWIPMFTLVAASFLGFIDDLLVIRENGEKKRSDGGIRFIKRLFLVGLIGFVGALWFYFKLDWTTIRLPFIAFVDFGIWVIPFFIFIMIAVFSSSVIDGIDGLSGGVFAAAFSSYAAIAFARGQYDLSAFCAVIVGAILAFLWFNIPPARFYMTETGILGLTTTLAVVSFFTDSVFLLPIIGLPLVATSLSNILQILSKKFRGKKLFQVAPLHHHFEAIGWPAAKVTMRYWLIASIAAVLGLVLALADLAMIR